MEMSVINALFWGWMLVGESRPAIDANAMIKVGWQASSCMSHTGRGDSTLMYLSGCR